MGRIWPAGRLLACPMRPTQPSHGPTSSSACRPRHRIEAAARPCRLTQRWGSRPRARRGRGQPGGSILQKKVGRGAHWGCRWRRCTVGGGSTRCGDAPVAGGIGDMHGKVSREVKLGEAMPNGEEREGELISITWIWGRENRGRWGSSRCVRKKWSWPGGVSVNRRRGRKGLEEWGRSWRTQAGSDAAVQWHAAQQGAGEIDQWTRPLHSVVSLIIQIFFKQIWIWTGQTMVFFCSIFFQ
jgi:hypothetical protein